MGGAENQESQWNHFSERAREAEVRLDDAHGLWGEQSTESSNQSADFPETPSQAFPEIKSHLGTCGKSR